MKTFVYVSYLKDHKNLFTSQCLFFTEYHVGASERKKKKKKKKQLGHTQKKDSKLYGSFAL